MSLGSSENTIRDKLMDILEEELAALKLKDTDKRNEIDNHPNDDEGYADKKTFSSSRDTTAELLKDVDNNQNEGELKLSETVNLPSKIVAEEIQRPSKYQHQEIELIHQEKATNQKNERSAENLDAKVSDEKVRIDDEDNFVPPPDRMAEKIKQKAESYFEDYNLFKNSFLLSHLRRNKKGYVSVKLMSSLRKIRVITRDYRDVAYSLKNSKILELNPEGNKICRIEPIPKIEDTSYGKTLMVFNLPSQNLSPEGLREMFSKFGTVVSAGIYEIDYPASDVYHQRCFFFHRKIASKVYGIIEFEKYDEVVKALKDEEGHLPKENEVKAVPLLPQIYKKERRYLKFLNARPYNSNLRRGYYDRYRPRNDFYGEVNSNVDMRNEKINMRGGYKRGYFGRPYRGRRTFVPSNTKSFGDDYFPREWNQHFRGGMFKKKWEENRQLRSNNSLNIDRLYPNTHRRRPGNGYYE